MSERMQLSAEDYQEIQAHGPTRLTEEQYSQMVRAVERIKYAAFWDGRRTQEAARLACKEATHAD